MLAIQGGKKRRGGMRGGGMEGYGAGGSADASGTFGGKLN